MTKLLWPQAQGVVRPSSGSKRTARSVEFGRAQRPVQPDAPLAYPGSATLKAYHLAAKPKFGAAVKEGFNFQAFQKESLKSNMSRTLQQAMKATPLPVITAEDFVLELCRDFQKDLTAYKASSVEERLRFYPQSYLGQALGMTTSPDFLKNMEKSGKLIQLDALATSLGAEQRNRVAEYGDTTPIEASKKVPDDTLANVFQKADQAATAAEKDLIGGDIILQLIGKFASGPAGDGVRALQENSVLRYALDVEDYLGSDWAASLSLSGDPAYGQNISEMVQDEAYQSFPLPAGDVRDALKVLRHPNRHMILNVPSGMNANAVVETLAAQSARKAGNEVGSRADMTFMRLDFPAFLKSLDKNERELALDDVVANLRSRLVEMTAEHGSVALHITNLEGLLAMTSPAALSRALSDLSMNGKVHLIFTPDVRTLHEIAASNKPGKPVFTLTNPSQLAGFVNVHLDKPPVKDLEAYLDKEIQTVRQRHPNLNFQPEAVRQAIQMAGRSGDPIAETVTAYLETAAQEVEEQAGENQAAELTADAVKSTVQNDPVFNYLDKAALHEPYWLMRADDLTEELQNSLPLVGQQDAQRVLTRIAKAHASGNPLEEAGIHTPKSLLVYGPAGTGKTPMLLEFAKQHDLPVVYISGSKLAALQDPARIEEAVRQAFEAARKESEQRGMHGQSRHVMVVADELESCFVQQAAGMQVSTVNPLLNIVATEAERASKQKGGHITTAALTNSSELAASIAKHPAYGKAFDELLETTPPPYTGDRQTVLEAAAKQIEDKLGYPVFEGVDFSYPARLLDGVSGKTLQEIVQRSVTDAQADTPAGEQVKVTAKRFSRTITELLTGPENYTLSKVIRPTDKKLTAYHEVGHAMGAAVMKRILGHTGPDVAKLTIVPQGHALGVTFYINEKHWEATKQSKSELLTRLVSAIASTPAEQHSLNEIHGGRSNDLEQVTRIAATMVGRLGMFGNRLVVPDPLADTKIRPIVDHVVEVAEKAAELIFVGYKDFIQELVTDLAGEDGSGGSQTIEGEDFEGRLDRYIAEHPQVAEQVKNDVLKLLVREGLLSERFQETRRFLPKAFRGIREVQSPYPEIDRLRALKGTDPDATHLPTSPNAKNSTNPEVDPR